MEVLLIFTILLLAPQSPVVCADDRIAVSPADATVQIGGSITLICSTTCPNGKPEWKKGLDALPYKPRTSGERSEIEIQDAQTEHEGTYMCVVMCEQKAIRKRLVLTVFFVPSMSTSFLRKPLGEPASFTCKADPSFSISWAKTGSQGAWAPPGHWNLSVSAGLSLVHIEALQPGDSGNYSCILKNEATKVALSITIEVSYAPKNTSLTPSEPSVKEGDPLTLTCRGDASPEPQIRWTKLNSTLPDSWSLSTGQGQSTLTAPSLAPEHSGTYQCEISNGIGREALTTTLDVLYSPRNIGADSGVITGNKGQPLKINCSWDANPKPDIQWLKLGSEKQDHWEISESGKNSQLRINALGSDDLGVYTCLIRNKMGEIHSNTTVRATGEHGVQTMTITIATALPALGLSLFGALVGWLRKNRQSSLSINP